MVQVPGTLLDTRVAGDRLPITDLLAWERITDTNLQAFVATLANLPDRTPYEENIFQGAFVRWVRRADANAVYTQASQGGVWCNGRVIFNETPYGTQAPLVRAGTANPDGAYVNPQHIFTTAQLEATKNDAEVTVLDTLSNTITGYNWANLASLRVFLTGSQGPCGMCQRRIQALITDLNTIAYTNHRNHQIKLVFQANYTTIYQPNVTQRGLPTQYGYPDAAPVVVLPNAQGSYTFWSKVFEFTLGAQQAVAF